MEMADTEEGVTLTLKNLAWLEVHGWHCLDNVDSTTPQPSSNPSTPCEFSQIRPNITYVCTVLK